MFLSHGILIKKGKPFETPCLFKSIFLPFLNRCSSPARLSSFFSIFYTKNISLRLCRPALFCENYLDTSFCVTYIGGAMKTQMMQFRVNDEEKALIEKCAKKAGMTVSEYIRACMLMEMVVDREMQALKIIGRTIGMKAMDALSRRLKANPILD